MVTKMSEYDDNVVLPEPPPKGEWWLPGDGPDPGRGSYEPTRPIERQLEHLEDMGVEFLWRRYYEALAGSLHARHANQRGGKQTRIGCCLLRCCVGAVSSGTTLPVCWTVRLGRLFGIWMSCRRSGTPSCHPVQIVVLKMRFFGRHERTEEVGALRRERDRLRAELAAAEEKLSRSINMGLHALGQAGRSEHECGLLVNALGAEDEN